jgi:hypothetical protein
VAYSPRGWSFACMDFVPVGEDGADKATELVRG